MHPERTTASGQSWWVFLLAAFLYACVGGTGSLENQGENEVLATVNGDKISVAVFKKEISLLKKQYRVEGKDKLKPEQLLFLKTKALNNLVQSLLFKQEADKNKIFVSEEEFKQRLMEIKNDPHDELAPRSLKADEISRADWEDKMRNILLIKNLINKVVNSKVSVENDELLEYFKKNPQEFNNPAQVRALHLMVSTEEEARDILKELESGKSKFSDLARKHSLGPEGANGGDLGYFAEGRMPEEFDSIFKLNVNEVSEVIRTPYGFHLFKVTDKKTESVMSFEESRKLIYSKLLQERQEEAFQKWVQEIKNQAKIEINDAKLAQIN